MPSIRGAFRIFRQQLIRNDQPHARLADILCYHFHRFEAPDLCTNLNLQRAHLLSFDLCLNPDRRGCITQLSCLLYSLRTVFSEFDLEPKDDLWIMHQSHLKAIKILCRRLSIELQRSVLPVLRNSGLCVTVAAHALRAVTTSTPPKQPVWIEVSTLSGPYVQSTDHYRGNPHLS